MDKAGDVIACCLPLLTIAPKHASLTHAGAEALAAALAHPACPLTNLALRPPAAGLGDPGAEAIALALRDNARHSRIKSVTVMPAERGSNHGPRVLRAFGAAVAARYASMREAGAAAAAGDDVGRPAARISPYSVNF